MLRRSVAFATQAAELSSALFIDYLCSHALNQDFIAALCSIDQALFSIGLRTPMRLWFVFQRVFSVRIAQRFCESIVGGVMCCGPPLCVDSVTWFMTNTFWQERVFAGFFIPRLLKWLARVTVPTRIQNIAMYATQDVVRDEEIAKATTFATGFREEQASHGIVKSVIASNLVADLASLVSDQMQWMQIYVREVFWRRNKASASMRPAFLRTFKSHVASTVLSLAEMGLHLGTRMLGKAVAGKIFRADHCNSVSSFWCEHVLLCVASPFLERIAHGIAGLSYLVTERLFPASDAENAMDEEEANEHHEAEADQREHYLSTQTKDDLYAALEIPSTATEGEVKRAYRKKALQLHPDRVSHLSDEERAQAQQAMANVNQAYEVLSCEEKRAAYDAQRTVSFDPENPPALLQQFLNLPLPLQIPIALGCVVSVAWLGGVVLYGHLKSHFMILSAPGRAPMRRAVFSDDN